MRKIVSSDPFEKFPPLQKAFLFEGRLFLQSVYPSYNNGICWVGELGTGKHVLVDKVFPTPAKLFVYTDQVVCVTDDGESTIAKCWSKHAGTYRSRKVFANPRVKITPDGLTVEEYPYIYGHVDEEPVFYGYSEHFPIKLRAYATQSDTVYATVDYKTYYTVTQDGLVPLQIPKRIRTRDFLEFGCKSQVVVIHRKAEDCTITYDYYDARSGKYLFESGKNNINQALRADNDTVIVCNRLFHKGQFVRRVKNNIKIIDGKIVEIEKDSKNNKALIKIIDSSSGAETELGYVDENILFDAGNIPLLVDDTGIKFMAVEQMAIVEVKL